MNDHRHPRDDEATCRRWPSSRRPEIIRPLTKERMAKDPATDSRRMINITVGLLGWPSDRHLSEFIYSFCVVVVVIGENQHEQTQTENEFVRLTCESRDACEK